jgi:hypothetical protein
MKGPPPAFPKAVINIRGPWGVWKVAGGRLDNEGSSDTPGVSCNAAAHTNFIPDRECL